VGEDGLAAPVNTRQPRADMVGRVRLSHVEAAGAYETRVGEAVFPDDAEDGISQSDLPLVMTGGEGRAVAERWLAESRVARDTISFALPPSRRDIGAGTIFEMADGSSWRVDRVEDAGARQVEAVRSEMEIYDPSDTVDEAVTFEAFVPLVPVSPVLLDLPLLTGDEVAHAPHLAVAAVPWPGVVAAYSSANDSGYTLNSLIERRSVIGVLESPLFRAEPGNWDRGPAFRVRLSAGALASVPREEVLNGANAAAIGDGDGANWEVIQFADATLVGEDLWDITMRLRGQAGSDGTMPPDWPVGSLFVLLDGGPQQIELALSARGLARHYRIGQAAKSYDHPSYVHRDLAFDGIGLRPYAPAHLRAPQVGAGREIAWIRRTRIDGDSWQGTEVPLGEDVESYILRIRDSGGVLQREVTIGTPAFSYSDAMRASDWVTAPYTIEVAQVSARFGPGPFARIEIND
jgi:putative tail protein